MLARFQGPAGERALLQAFRDQHLVGGQNVLAAALVAKAQLLEFKPGEQLIVQEAADNDIYFLLAGEVAVEVHGNEVARRRAKVHVGEMALLEPSARRSATVRAIQATVAAKVSEPDFAAIAEEHPKMWRLLAIEVAERLRQRGQLLRKRNALPIVFVGSSYEALPIAKPLQVALLSPSVEVRLWTHDVFRSSNFPIEDLEAQAQESDFAVLVANADDVVTSRRKRKPIPRDNVIFELGLFMGTCGRKRTFVVQPAGVALKLPSDLLGMTPIRYDNARLDYIQVIADELLQRFAEAGPR